MLKDDEGRVEINLKEARNSSAGIKFFKLKHGESLTIK